ncbi:MAG: cell division ATP-binding protein FtsE [Gammaproteobacteria bacterium]|nr:MAG: cell division ATP-binding protein FtsE [Gammaproteobacteria bacterium]
MIRFIQVSKRYPSCEALRHVSFHLAPGEMAFLTGRSGAGKSTLLKLIPLIERPSSGQVLFQGQNINRLRPRQIPWLRRRVGMVFQAHRLLEDRTVFDNVALPLIIEGLPYREVGRRVRAALDRVGLLGKERLYPVQLSGGEQQRVGIARAVVNRPPVLLADEPTGNLDPELSFEIMKLFERLHQLGTTVLIASHDTALIARMGYRVLSLNQGRLVSR